MKKLIIIELVCVAFLCMCIIVTMPNIALADEKKREDNADVAYYNGGACAPNEVIIVYENTYAANEYKTEIKEKDETNKQALQERTSDNERGILESNQAQERTSVDIIGGSKQMVVVELDDGIEMDEYIEIMNNDPSVKYVEPNYIYTINATVNDPYALLNSAGYAWHLYTTNTFDAWDITYGGSGVVIGVIDTGVDIDHPDLNENILAHTDTAENDGSADDTSGHGTKVSGYIAAEANNSIGSSGVAPGCKLIAVDAFITSTSAYTDDILEGIDYLIAQNVDIINMSFCGPNFSGAFEAKIHEAYNAGIIVVASAGNDSTDDPAYPADYPYVISVMASDINDDYIAPYSNFGTEKDITAPGTSIVSTAMGGGYASGSGTSFAGPVVAGAIALMLSVDSTLSFEEISNILYATTINTCKNVSGFDTDYGAGRIDIGAAVLQVYNNLRVTGVSLFPEEGMLSVNETLQLSANVWPERAENKSVTYSSSSSTIASVSTTGLVTAHQSGDATITVTTNEGGYTAVCNLSVGIYVTGISVMPTASSIDVGTTLQLVPTIIPADATNKNVTYASSDEAIATVDASGLVTGVSLGEANITVITADGGHTTVCNLSVGTYVTGVSVTPTASNIDVGATLQLVTTITPAEATNKNVIYTSSDEAIATVDASGILTGVSLGEAVITLTTADGGYTAVCNLSVGTHVTGILVTPTASNIDVGATLQLVPTIIPANATNKNIIYTSSDEAIATVDNNGLITAISVGSVSITATTEDKALEVSASITVVAYVAGIALSPQERHMLAGTSLELVATIIPANATNQNITYTSNDTNVATVDAAGVISANALGSATITATTLDGGHTATCTIHVVQELITSSVYGVNRSKLLLEDIVIDATYQDVIDAIDNVLGEVQIYNPAMELVTQGSVGTAYYVKLVIDGAVADQLQIVIEGECNSDAQLDVIDYTLVRLHILNVMPLEGIFIETADVNDDGIIDVVDYTLIRLHILKVMGLY